MSKGCKRRSLTVMSGTRITRIPLDATAQREGYLAGRRGIAVEANPYQAGTPAALAWGIGWVSGLKKQLRPVSDAPFPLVSIKPRPNRRSIENCVGPSAASRQPSRLRTWCQPALGVDHAFAAASSRSPVWGTFHLSSTKRWQVHPVLGMQPPTDNLEALALCAPRP